MSCVLIARGREFNVDGFLNESELKPHNIARKGEIRLPGSTRAGEPYEDSGFSIMMGETGLDGFLDQINEAIEFLNSNMQELQKLREYPGLEEIVLDFSVRNERLSRQHYKFFPEIVTLASRLGAAIEISHYAVERPVSLGF